MLIGSELLPCHDLNGSSECHPGYDPIPGVDFPVHLGHFRVLLSNDRLHLGSFPVSPAKKPLHREPFLHHPENGNLTIMIISNSILQQFTKKYTERERNILSFQAYYCYIVIFFKLK